MENYITSMKTIYIVRGSTGEYAERAEWLVKAFSSDQKAAEFVGLVSNEAALIAAARESQWDEPGHNKYDINMQMKNNGTYYNYETLQLEE